MCLNDRIIFVLMSNQVAAERSGGLSHQSADSAHARGLQNFSHFILVKKRAGLQPTVRANLAVTREEPSTSRGQKSSLSNACLEEKMQIFSVKRLSAREKARRCSLGGDELCQPVAAVSTIVVQAFTLT